MNDILTIEAVLRQYFARKHLIRHIGKLIQTKNNKMNPYQPNDPRNNFLEEVYLGKRFWHLFHDVKLTYDSRNGGYRVESGSITNRQTSHGFTVLTIVSNSNNVYSVTRQRGGGYKADSQSWISVTRKPI